jgi:type I restriction enzyme S subunit
MIRLGNVINVNPESIHKDYPFDEIEYIDISSVGTGTLQGTQRLQLEGAPSRARRIVKDSDTLLATVRPNLRSFWFARNPKVNTIASTGFAVLRANKDIDSRYLYYTVTNQSFTDYLTANAKGAAYPAVDTDTIERAEIYLLPLPTQRKIAAILSAYDDLIENNLRRIKILEEMAHNLYREWFVKFRFPGHQQARFTDSPLGRIPEGWEMTTLGAVSNVIPGYAFKSKDWADAGIPVIKIKNIRPGNLIDTDQVDHVPEGILCSTHKKYWLYNGDILIAMTGATAGKVGKLRSKKSMLLNQRVAKIEPKQHFKEFVWCTVSSPGAEERFYALADGAAQPNMSGSQIEDSELLVPSADLVQQFNDFVSPFVNDVDNMILRNQALRRTRDLLLPRLISGEVDVSELDITVPEEAVT